MGALVQRTLRPIHPESFGKMHLKVLIFFSTAVNTEIREKRSRKFTDLSLWLFRMTSAATGSSENWRERNVHASRGIDARCIAARIAIVS